MSGSGSITVLFVDDEQAILQVILRKLHGSPFEVLTVENAADALEVLRRVRIDVLVSDIDMPNMSGLELMKVVRRESPNTLRMLLTGAATLERTLTAINEGEVLRCFVKPFDPELFRRTISSLVERIERLRGQGGNEAQEARRREFLGWVEGRFPGVTDVQRDEYGRVVIDAPGVLHQADMEGSRVPSLLLPKG